MSLNKLINDLEFAEDIGDVDAIRLEMREKLLNSIEHLTNILHHPLSEKEKDLEVHAALLNLMTDSEIYTEKVEVLESF